MSLANDLNQLNTKQLEAVNELDKNVLLSAGAGTGKTLVLTYRVLNILQQNRATPEEILCLTFTNKACKEMKQRIEQSLGMDITKKITIKTIHSFAYYLMNSTYKDKEEVFQEYSIIDDEDQAAILNDINNKIASTASFGKYDLNRFIEKYKQARILLGYTSGDIAKDYTNLYHHLVEANRLMGKDEDFHHFFDRGGLDILIAYEEKLQECHCIDYKDLISNAYIILHSPELSQKWISQYKYILLDEFQDTSTFEYNTLEPLFRHAKTMLCGDMFQTIYGWRGSEPERILTRYIKEYTPVEINLNENYRCTRILLELAYNTLQSLFSEETINNSYARNLQSKSAERGHKIPLKAFNNGGDEASWIFQKIIELLPQVSDPREIAILTRNNRSARRLYDALSRKAEQYSALHPQDKVLFTEVEDYKFFKRAEIKDVMAIFRYLVNPYDNIALKRILMNLVPNIGIITISQIQSNEYRKLGLRLSDFISMDYQQYTEPYQPLIEAFSMGTRDIVVYDVEATGTDIFSDRIIQLSAVKTRHGKIIDTFDEYLKVDVPVGDSEKVHHISDEFLASEGQEPSKVLKKFKEFIQNCYLAGHNIWNYDNNILNENLRYYNLPTIDFADQSFDTLDMCRRFYPNSQNHKLEYLSEKFSFETKSNHNSFEDVKANWELLKKLLEEEIIPSSLARTKLIASHKQKFANVVNLFNTLRGKFNSDSKPKALLATIVDIFNLSKVYKGDTLTGQQRIENLRQLYRIMDNKIKDRTGKEGLQELLQLSALSSNYDLLPSDYPIIPIITIHQAKGLEFNYEFLADVSFNVFPNSRSCSRGIIEDEEKRIFYVAITRAKQQLFITYVKTPSPLLKYIPEQFLDRE